MSAGVLAKVLTLRGNAFSHLHCYDKAIKDFSQAAELYNEEEMFDEEQALRDDISKIKDLQLQGLMTVS